MPNGQFLKPRLFLEGIEVDVISADVECGINRPATATIQLPPVSAGFLLLPRTLVHLFYYDNRSLDKEGRRALPRNDWKAWHLLFAGEVLSYRFASTGGARQLSLLCHDFSSYWGSARLYWGGTKKAGFMNMKRAMFAGASQVHKPGSKSKSTIVNLLTRSPVTNPGLTGLLGGLMALLEQCCGVFDGNAVQKFRGANDFMSQAEARLHLTRMLGAAAQDDSSAAFIKSKQFRRFFKRITSSVRATASYAQLVDTILGKVYHQYSSIAAPPYFAAGEEVSVRTRVPKSTFSFSGNSQLKALYQAVADAYAIHGRRLDRTLAAAAIGGETLDDPTRAVQTNASYPDGSVVTRVDVAGHEEYNREITATKILGYDKARLASLSVGGTQAAAGKGRAAESRAASVSLALGKIERAVVKIKFIMHRRSSGVADPYPNHNWQNLSDAHALLGEAKAQLKPINAVTYTTKTKKVALDDRLNMFLFSPDIYMVPPPTCNVLFPDDYATISYSRDWMRETTRLWMFGRTESGKDKKDIYFAPNVSMIGIPGMDKAVEAAKKGASFTMRHEQYTGIIPAFQGIGDNGIFKTINKKQIKEDAAAGGDGSKVSGRAAHSPQAHLQRAANFLFFSMRFSSRQMQTSGRFLPRLVPGIPALALDSALRQRVTSDVALSEHHLIPAAHFVGTPAVVKHSFNASGGASTSVSYVKCRIHDEGLDLFGDATEGETQVKHTRTTSHTLKPRAGDEFVVEYRGKHEGDRTNYARMDHVTADSVAGGGFVRKKGARYLIRPKDFRKDHGIGSDQTINDTADGHRTLDDPNYARADTNVSQGPTQDQQNNALIVDVVETRTSVDWRKLEFSLEDTLTPPWFAKIYRRETVGPDYYQLMLGCPSILDQGVVPLTDEEIMDAVLAAEKARHTADPAERAELEQLVLEFPIRSADGKTITMVKLPEMTAYANDTTAAMAVALADLWVSLKRTDADVDLFISSYTNRRFATLEDIMGTKNQSLRALRQTNGEPIKTEGVLGFHGNAYGNMEAHLDIDGEPLVSDKLKKGIEGHGDEKGLSPDADPRAERRARVIVYVDELQQIAANSALGRIT